MAMSSSLINSNYVDPKFPPCEEYSQSDYLPIDHSPGYYAGGQRRESSFQPEAGFGRRSACTVQRYAACRDPGPPPPQPPPPPPPPPPGLSPRAPAQPPSGALLPEPGQRCEAISSSPPPPPCVHNPLHHSPSHSACKEPVVYPWMRKSSREHGQPQLRRRGAQALSDRLHSPAGLGAGEGISLQPLPDTAPEGGDRPRALPLRAPDQDLVPEPAHEVEKRPQVAQHQDPLGRHRRLSRRAPWPAQRRPPCAL
ncbi:TPA: homeobox protein Hox-B4 [Bos taurus]|nr:TPA: homeobox protein Hox-B4 [Bos taurus]